MALVNRFDGCSFVSVLVFLRFLFIIFELNNDKIVNSVNHSRWLVDGLDSSSIWKQCFLRINSNLITQRKNFRSFLKEFCWIISHLWAHRTMGYGILILVFFLVYRKRSGKIVKYAIFHIDFANNTLANKKKILVCFVSALCIKDKVSLHIVMNHIFLLFF